jgi:hypothetical protein
VEALALAVMRKLDQPEAERQGEAAGLSAFIRTRFSMQRMADGVLAGYAAAHERRAEALPVPGAPAPSR